MLSIANNVTSLSAQNSLLRTNNNLSKSLERLSSGLKVNRGADGPAALVISEQQRAQISGLRAAIDNTNKAISVVQTGEGALNEINSLLVKARSLMIDSANTGVNDANALAANQAEINNIISTIDRIANTTQFGSRRLLDGTASVAATASDSDVTISGQLANLDSVQAGTYAVNIGTAAQRAVVESATVGVTGGATLAATESLTVNGVTFSFAAGSSQSDIITTINANSASQGFFADANGAGGRLRIISTAFGGGASLSVQSSVAESSSSSGFDDTAATDAGVNMTVNFSLAGGATITATSSDANPFQVSFTSGNLNGLNVNFTAPAATSTGTTGISGAQGNLSIADNSLVFQLGANQGQTAALRFDDMNTTELGVGVSTSVTSLNALSSTNAAESLRVIDNAIDSVSRVRGRLGAFQGNTLQSNLNNLRVSLENTTAAESVIRDTDFASEIANFTRFQTQIQAGTSVLGNANQLTALVANLLRG